MRIKIIIGIIVIIILAFLVWLFWASTRSLPGTKLTDLGREHIEIGKEVNYNSNPPTSGSHYVDWVRAGVYVEEKDDRNLVHSLEHGYVIMSYRCNMENQGNMDDKGEATQSGTVDKKEDCESRKNQLEEIYNKKGKRKLIVVPRPNLDTNFALTAWNYLDKFAEFDAARVEKFIDAHLNNGPERTME
ncbi:hypothetical protein A3F00_03185 [Candidatus Daviesbacteria bacterium RIFCSPHIGHO2_12_FULL_37_11]|uniref:DUF3105 domain-containing protein n=1 Tax=Candidatus Daviesbacteria bacterium RIFCSPHIGHO2_12_FULL_37_11 TaxID=1797777 RepID=A0A1F5KA38_9BACT|nr:MAG: hypothetical protein A2111_02145 [Candidatus Daviesbacteria bacterium GWA1_38_6]OGE37822.1 MAG: hypothetical protein A3F00_03185 [Candidatus Daviesbacteria bacterium RIFCSPHIGHO2_12_FULL_37_11]OGE45454.1 MAG: hypothetical protein A3B39_04380 [Candidatus Daviesbacteria bacterium RIFCSPLOWO2_01_FULL_37_10]